MPQDRQERHLMRQRGAGTRRLDNASFGFTFGTSAKQPPPPPSPASRSTAAAVTATAIATVRTPSQLASSQPPVNHSTRRNRSSKKPKPTLSSSHPLSVQEPTGRSSLVASRNDSDICSGASAAEKHGSASNSTSSINDAKIKSVAPTRAVRAGKSKGKSKIASRNLRKHEPAPSPSALATATPSVTGKRKRGRGLLSSTSKSKNNVIGTVREEEEDNDELGQENIDTRFSPSSSLTLRKNKASTAKTTALRETKSPTRQPSNRRQRRPINDNGNDNNGDDGVDELASPGHLEKRVRRTDNGGVAVRKTMKKGHRIPSVMMDNDDDEGDEISSATNSVITALLSRKSEGKTSGTTLRESGNDKRRVPVSNGYGKGEKVSLKDTGRKSRREPAEIEAAEHTTDTEKSIKTSAESSMSSSEQKLAKGRARGRPRGKAKPTEKDDVEPESANKTTTRTKVKKSESRNTEALGNEKTALSDQGPVSSLVVSSSKAPKLKQTRARKEKNEEKKNKKPLAPRPSDPEISSQSPSDENERLSQPNCHTEEILQESAETERLLKEAKQPSTGFLSAQQPNNSIDNDQKSVSTTNSAASSFTTATTASTQPSTINSLASFPHIPEGKDVKTAEVHAHSESKISTEIAANLLDNVGDDNVVLPDHQPDPADTIDVDDDIPSIRARSDTSKRKHAQRQVLDLQREKEAIKTRLEEARREEHQANESAETREREKLTKLMKDLRHVVRSGRARAREVGWSGEMSLVSSAKGAQGIGISVGSS